MRKTVLFLFTSLCLFVITGVNAQVTVSGASAGNGSYTTLGAAFTAIAGSTGAIDIEITGNTTEAAGGITLAAGPWTSVTIFPTGGPWTISGAVTAGTPLVTFNGSDNVTINGSNNLIFSNTTASNTTGTSTLKLVADATNNTFNNVTFLGSGFGTGGSNTAVIWISTGSSTGNDGNSFQGCKFGPAGSNLPTQLMVANGSTTSVAIENSGITVNNCDFYDYFQAAVSTQAAIYVATGNTNWTISNNRIYQTAPRTITSASTIYGIYCVNNNATATGTSFSITGNIIGYSSNAQTGTMTYEAGSTAGSFTGILFNASNSAVTTNNINNNTISNFQWTSTGSSVFNGISTTSMTSTTSGHVLNLNSNKIKNISWVNATGQLTGILSGYSPSVSISNNEFDNITRSGSGILYCINYTGTSSSAFTFDQNTITNISNTSSASTSALYGIYSVSSPATETWTNNLIDGISSNSTGGQTVLGIYNATATTGNKTCQNNTVRNISLPAASTGSIYGLRIGYIGAISTVSNNTIYNLSGGATIVGLLVGGTAVTSASTSVYKNKIYDLSTNNASGTTFGLQLATLGTSSTTNVYNNYIGNLTAASTSLSTDGVRGINITSVSTTSNINLSFNTVYLNATSSGAEFSTSGVYHTYNATATSGALTMKNNLIANLSVPNGSGKSSVFRRSAATDLGNYSSSSNNNLFYNGTATNDKVIFYDGTNFDASLTAFKNRVTPREANSVRENPPFLSTTGSNSNFLHINTGTPTLIEGGGIAVTGITDDFDGNARNNPPDIGADEFDGQPAVPMQFVSLNTSQVEGFAYANNNNQAVLRISVVTTGAANPITVSGLTVNANGTTSLSDITNAKVYYTGGATEFSASTIFGTATPPSYSDYSFTGSQELIEGANYFWVVYDLPESAVTGNEIDAELISVEIDGSPETPAIPAPVGSRTILNKMAGNYNVGAGQVFPNFTTITDAIADLKVRGISANVTLTLTNSSATPYNMANGESFPIIIDSIAGTGPNTVTIKPAAGKDAVITGSTVTLNGLIKLNSADYIIIDGVNSGGASLTISNTATVTATAGIWISSNGAAKGATNSTIKNCIVETGTIAQTTYGIYIGGSSISTTGTGADNNSITIQNNTVRKASYGIYARGVATTGELTGLVISGNEIGSDNSDEYVTDYGIQIASVNGADISNNHIFNMISNNTKYGIYFVTNVSNTNISKNKIHGLGYTNTTNYATYGIYFSSTTGCTDNRIDNNLIYDIRAYGTTTATSGHGGIRIVGGTNYKIYYNSISITDTIKATTSGYISHCLSVTTASTGMDIRNNVFYNARVGGTSPKNYAIYTVASTTYTNCNYNNYYTNGAALGYIGGTERANLAAIKTGTGQDGSSIASDPKLVSSTNMQPQLSSPLLNNGTPIPGFDEDYNGEPRSGNTSIGAFENGVDLNGPTISFTALSNTSSVSNRTIAVTITDDSGVEAGADAPKLNFKKDPSGAFTSVDATSEAGNVYTFTFDYSLIGGVAEADTIWYYISAEDILGNASTNPLNGSASPAYYFITPQLSGTYTVGVGKNFTNLTSVANILNASNSEIIGDVIFELTSDYSSSGETFPIKFTQPNRIGGTWSITIRPETSTSHTISTSVNTPIIDLDGISNIFLDGRPGGIGSTKAITITNSSTATGATNIRFINGAANATVRYLNLNAMESSSTTRNIEFSTSTSTANANNVVEYSELVGGRYGIYFNGTSGTPNDNNTIRNCNISNCTFANIYLANNSNNTILQENNIFQTAASSTANYGITINSNTMGGTNNLIIRNRIYDLDNTGTTTLKAINFVNAAASSVWTIRNNFISLAKDAGTKTQVYGIHLSGADNYTVNIYNNSIYIGGTHTGGTASSTVSAGFYKSTTGAGSVLNFKNNIVYNTRTGGTSGVFHLGANFNATAGTNSIDYNVYRCTASSGAYHGGWGGTVYSALSGYQTASGMEANTKFTAANFVSSTDLHLTGSTLGNLDFYGTPITGVTVDIDGETRKTINPYKGADEVYVPGMWTGNESVNYDVAQNWDDNTVPGAASDIIIPTGVANMPMLSSAKSVNKVELRSNATLTINGQSFTINDAVSGSGTISGSSTSNLTIDGTAGTLNFTSGSRSLNNLTINNSKSATLGTDLDIYGALTITGASLDVNSKSLTLKSTASATARVADMTGASLTNATNIIIERFIPAKRAWRLLAAPLSTTGAPTIQNSWMEGATAPTADPKSGYGTHITGTGTGYFDASIMAPSIKIMNAAGTGWADITGTDAAITNYPGYLLFVRGDRSIDLSQGGSATPTNTVLRMKGSLKTGQQPVSVSGSSAYQVVGNPYASPIDFSAITRSANINDEFYVWDPKRGTFGAWVTFINGSTVGGAGGSYAAANSIVESGQAFLVRSNDSNDGSLTIEEEDKTTGTGGNVFKTSGADEMVDIQLNFSNNGVASLADAASAWFNTGYSKLVTSEDINKMANFNENIVFTRQGSNLVLERRPLIVDNDTLFVKLWNTTVRAYQLKLALNVNTSLDAQLEDLYLNTTTPLSTAGETLYDFSVTSDPLSANQNRFRIVFKAASTLPVKFVSVEATRKDRQVQVDWTIGNEVDIKSYEVERSSNGASWLKIATRTAVSNHSTFASYSAMDANPLNGDNYYRIKAIEMNGKEFYSPVVKVKTTAATTGEIVLYPNPVTGNQLSISFKNVKQGNYKVKVYNALGQEVYHGAISYEGGSASKNINVPAFSNPGLYTLIISNDEVTFSQRVVSK